MSADHPSDAPLAAPSDARSVDARNAEPELLNGTVLAGWTAMSQAEADLAQVGLVAGIQRGRHTTTSSTLLRWDESSFVVDTPGVRSLGVWKIEPATLAWYFPDLDAFSSWCRFSGCSHTHEPDCGVKAAAEVGEIPRQRYESYPRMMDG